VTAWLGDRLQVRCKKKEKGFAGSSQHANAAGFMRFFAGGQKNKCTEPEKKKQRFVRLLEAIVAVFKVRLNSNLKNTFDV
jgi:hypothetical protein